MYWFVSFNKDAIDHPDYGDGHPEARESAYDVMSEKRASCTPEGHEVWLRHSGFKLTQKKFENENEVVRYAERLLLQDNIPDEIRRRLKAFIGRYYTGTAYILDSVDSEYKSGAKT